MKKRKKCKTLSKVPLLPFNCPPELVNQTLLLKMPWWPGTEKAAGSKLKASSYEPAFIKAEGITLTSRKEQS